MNQGNKTKRSCVGCAQLTQRIMVLENRVAYLEQNMMARSSTPIRRGRSRSRKSRQRPKKEVTKNSQPTGGGSSSTQNLPNKIAELKISTLPEYIPTQQPAVHSELNPIAPSFSPGYYFYHSSGQIGPEGGAAGYQ